LHIKIYLFNSYGDSYIFKALLNLYNMQLFDDLDSILNKIENNVKINFRKIKNNIKEFPKYSDKRLREIRDKTYYGLRKVKDGISKYAPIIGYAAIAASPLYAKASILTGLYAMNSYGGVKGKVLGYVLIWLGAAVTVGLGLIAGLHAMHSLPSSNHVQYLGSPNGYEAFVPHNTINYDGHTDPVGDLILPNRTIINHVIWDGQYANTIIQNHKVIDQLNSVWVSNNSWASPVDPLNGQQLKPMQDVVVIKGLIPIENIILNNQTYYVIVADGIKSEYIAEFYTSKELIPDLVNAMNTPGTIAELLPQLPGNTTSLLPANSPIFYWPNETGTVAFETKLYQYGSDFIGGYLLKQPHGPIIPYGIIPNPSGLAFLKFTAPKQVYNPYS